MLQHASRDEVQEFHLTVPCVWQRQSCNTLEPEAAQENMMMVHMISGVSGKMMHQTTTSILSSLALL